MLDAPSGRRNWKRCSRTRTKVNWARPVQCAQASDHGCGLMLQSGMSQRNRKVTSSIFIARRATRRQFVYSLSLVGPSLLAATGPRWQ